MALTISSPDNDENDLCPSDFQPNGNLNGSSGTITVKLSGAYSADATQVTVLKGTWTAQFAAFSGPVGPCTLKVYLDGVEQDSKTGLQFQDC